jgi:hypothetical protein
VKLERERIRQADKAREKDEAIIRLQRQNEELQRALARQADNPAPVCSRVYKILIFGCCLFFVLAYLCDFVWEQKEERGLICVSIITSMLIKAYLKFS